MNDTRAPGRWLRSYVEGISDAGLERMIEHEADELLGEAAVAYYALAMNNDRDLERAREMFTMFAEMKWQEIIRNTSGPQA